MLELALVYAIDGEPEKLGKAEVLCERILSGRPTDTVFCTARAVLCYIYLKHGDKDKAITAAQLLPHEAVCRFTVLKEIENNPSMNDINRCLNSIMFRDNAEHDILVIDFGLDMIPMVTEGKLLEIIKEMREKCGKDKNGRIKIPAIRVRDNIELLPNQLRLRYYADYLIDKQFTDYNTGINEILEALCNIAKRTI